MARLSHYLTLPGFGGGSAPPPPPPPAAPAPAPTMVEASQTRQMVDARRRQQTTTQGMQGSVRNVGGARGLGITETARALKALTGQ
jgi:hypothetical protein